MIIITLIKMTIEDYYCVSLSFNITIIGLIGKIEEEVKPKK